MASEMPPSSSLRPPTSTTLDTRGMEAEARIHSTSSPVPSMHRWYTGRPVSTSVQTTQNSMGSDR